jgi:hypothetical protein
VRLLIIIDASREQGGQICRFQRLLNQTHPARLRFQTHHSRRLQRIPLRRRRQRYSSSHPGNIYSYPIRVSDPEIIAKSTNEQVKNISKYKIDKLQCYAALSSVFALSDEKLYVIDSALRKPEPIASKVPTS